MKKTAKRILSTLLIVVMLVGVAPMGGFKFTAKASAKTIEECSVGDIITFGSYPQSKVTDSDLIANIEAAGENETWVDYNYYTGSGNWDDGNMKPVDDMMLYKDIQYNGNKYRAVKINQYRPSYTGYTSSNTEQSSNSYYTGNIYYFKYEPLKWCVLDTSTGLVVCDNAIDSQPYNNYILYADSEFWGDSDQDYYASNWEYSSLREWLNNDFCNTAFSKTQQDRIQEFKRENESTNDSKYDSNSTSDKITLLSYDDVSNTSYGFSIWHRSFDTKRQRKGTDYAKCQGLYVYNNSGSSCDGNSWWWLRSPSDSYSAADIDDDGLVYNLYDVGITYRGVVPALNLNLSAKASAKTIEECSAGDIIYFGSYPQSEVKDSDIITKIEIAGTSIPWVDYNYYAGTGNGSDGEMKPVANMMLYKDIPYNGNKYRAVKINQYRPLGTNGISTALKTYQDDNGYYTGNTYYFKYEPLTWRVLDPSDGYVMCNQIIDSQAYQNIIYCNGDRYYTRNNWYNSQECVNYASDWVTSSLRQWLNNDLYNTAFTAKEKAQIDTTYLKNKSIKSDIYDSADTFDKIFLISYYDAKNSVYKFSSSSSWGDADTAKQMKGTDYAKCQGLYVSPSYGRKSSWWLRSPSYCNYATNVDSDGWTWDYYYELYNSCNVGDAYRGVVPAFKFNPKSTICDVHDYKAVVTEPTCTEQGYTTYTCTKCNDSYVDNYTNALGHDFGEWKLTTPATCTEIGVETRYCTRCDMTQTRDVDKSVHVFGEWKITTAPTTISDGVKTRYCKNCDAFETESVGKLKSISVKLNNIETNYKKSGQLEPKITNPDNVGYKVEYKSSDPKCVIVDADGNYFAVKTGSAKITCTVTDEYGKVTTAECKVNVKYSTVQWIIMIVLFGWIWY